MISLSFRGTHEGVDPESRYEGSADISIPVFALCAKPE